jgi:hypothetical protein
LGYYTFVDNAVPTSSQWNTNFRDQVVTQCTSGTRPTAVEGMVIYETDTDRLLYYSGAAWVIITEPIQSWTPTITQGATPTKTVNRGWSRRENGIWRARASVTFTSAGTAANAIVVTYPLTLSNSNDIAGGFTFEDTGTTIYTGRVHPNSTTTCLLNVTGNNGYFGAAPAVTIANTDVLLIDLEGTY